MPNSKHQFLLCDQGFHFKVSFVYSLVIYCSLFVHRNKYGSFFPVLSIRISFAKNVILNLMYAYRLEVARSNTGPGCSKLGLS